MHSSSKRDTELKLFSKTQFIYTHTHTNLFFKLYYLKQKISIALISFFLFS